MADGSAASGPAAGRKSFLPTEIFRCFQVALDPRKLAVAALGILAMCLGWYLLSITFYYDKPDPKDPYYSTEVVRKDFAEQKKPDGTPYSDADIVTEAQKRYRHDFNRWAALHELAGPGGRIRSMPWFEDRGENPYIFLSRLATQPISHWFDSSWSYFKKQLPVMAEPLTKLFLPIVKVSSPHASTGTRIYLFLVLVWSVLVWAFAGGVITRIAAVQLSGKDQVSIMQACRYVCKRYTAYALAPIVPVGVVGAIVVGIWILGIFCLIPVLGDLILGVVGIPLVIFGGVIMTVLFIGLVGYPLMASTLSAEGSDTFDALSRSYNYVFQSPWRYAWYWIVALVYGTIVTFFIVLVASLMVYLGKWALNQTPLSQTTNQQANYLFIFAPESFGWKELLLAGSPLQGRPTPTEDGTIQFKYDDPVSAQAYKDRYTFYNWFGVGLTTFWLTAVFLLMLGFSYSFFWSAATMIYLLMRQDVDEVELDDVYLEEDDDSFAAPAPQPTPYGAPASLPMVPPPPEPPPAAAAPPQPTPVEPPPAEPPPAEPTPPPEPEKNS